MAKKEETFTSNDSAAIKPEVKPLSEIFCDRSWNIRSDVAASQSDDDNTITKAVGGTSGFPGLLFNMADEGQKEPIDIRPNPNAGKSKGPEGRPYMVVAGHQRYLAREAMANGMTATLPKPDGKGDWTVDAFLASEGMSEDRIVALHTKNPTIVCRIHKNMTEEEALKFCLSENGLRNDVTTPDLCYGIKRLLEVNPRLEDKDIAHVIGKTPQYVTSLKQILLSIEKMPTEVKVGAKTDIKDAGQRTIKVKGAGNKEIPVLQAWREEPKKLPYRKLLDAVKGVDPEARGAAYSDAAKAYGTSGGGGGGNPDPTAWVGIAKEEAKDLGGMLARAELAGIFDLDTGVLSNPEAVVVLMSVFKDYGTKKRRGATVGDQAAWSENMLAVGKAIADAYVDTMAKEKAEQRKAREAAAAAALENGKGAATSAS